jgi:hypothetical protein
MLEEEEEEKKKDPEEEVDVDFIEPRIIAKYELICQVNKINLSKYRSEKEHTGSFGELLKRRTEKSSLSRKYTMLFRMRLIQRGLSEKYST